MNKGKIVIVLLGVIMKRKSKFIIGSIILFVIVGISLSYVNHVQKVKAAEDKRIIQTGKEMVKGLYSNRKKEALANDISNKKIAKALTYAKQLKDPLKKTLIKEINNIACLYKTKTDLDSILLDGVLIEDAQEKDITTITKSVDKTKSLNEQIYNLYKIELDEIISQFNIVKTANEKLLALFSDPEKTTVKNDVTRDMYLDAKKSIDSIKNHNIKETSLSLVAKVDSVLLEKEKQEMARQQQINNSSKTSNQTLSNTNQAQQTKAGNPVQNSTDLASIVAKSSTANKTNQIVTVVASGSSAQISLLEKNGSTWTEVIKTNGYVGSLGVGQAREGSSRTPKGSYSLGFAFGTSNPGTKLPFRQITPNSYWISNVNDPDYNTWQERQSAAPADEHLADYPVQYQYAIVINYNNGVGGGSAFFLHVENGRPTAGCVAVSQDVMIQFMQRIAPGAYIMNVNSQSELAYY